MPMQPLSWWWLYQIKCEKGKTAGVTLLVYEVTKHCNKNLYVYNFYQIKYLEKLV